MEPDDPCTCGHRRERHVDGAGRCLEPEGLSCRCGYSCSRFVLDGAALSRRNAIKADIDKQHDKIRRAREYLDANWSGEGWRPSELVTIGYSALVTGPSPALAASFIDDLLDQARDRYRCGYFANPFGDPVLRSA